MTTLYDLVFEIRQEVDDLNFRLQDTGAKVDIFLQTLSSLQSSLISSSDEDAPMEESVEATDEATDTAPDAVPRAAPGAATDANRASTVEAIDNVEHEHKWAS
jgi:hypothetical protein